MSPPPPPPPPSPTAPTAPTSYCRQPPVCVRGVVEGGGGGDGVMVRVSDGQSCPTILVVSLPVAAGSS